MRLRPSAWALCLVPGISRAATQTAAWCRTTWSSGCRRSLLEALLAGLAAVLLLPWRLLQPPFKLRPPRRPCQQPPQLRRAHCRALHRWPLRQPPWLLLWLR